uniref:SAP domain-containing protein n=1 Tax=Glossina austeni TaxID=7395 RepID=A0A1A9VHR3_GLOAU
MDQRKQELGKRNLRTVGSKAELKQRLVEHLEKEGEDLSILEFEYNIKGREQTDNLGGTENADTAREKLSKDGQFDARINAHEKDADAVKNEIKTLKEEQAKQQTNDVTTSSIKVKVPLFDGTINAFKLQFGVVATKNMWDDDDKAVVLITSLRRASAEIIQIIPEGKRTELAAIMDALERKNDSKHVKEVSHLELSTPLLKDFVTQSLKKLYGRHLKRRLQKRLASRLRKKQLVCCGRQP